MGDTLEKTAPTQTKKQDADKLLASLGLDPGNVGTGATTVPTLPKARSITWKLPAPVWHVGDTVTAGALADDDSGLDNMVLAEPKTGLQVAAADKLSVKITGAAKDGFAAAELVGTIDVLKHSATITWKAPSPVLVNTTLDAKQLNATLDPATLPVTYVPPATTIMTKLGEQILSVVCSDLGRYAPVPVTPVTTTLTVVASESELAGAFGQVEMQTGRCWKKPDPSEPGTAKAIEMLKKWDDDTDELRTQGQQIMAAIKDMTTEELIDYMNGLKKDKNFKDFVAVTKGPNGGLSDYPNDIWRFKNGLQVRYKPKGSDRQKGIPTFQMEVRTSDDTTEKQDGAACKVMPDGQAGPKGPGTTIIPDWIENWVDGPPGPTKQDLTAEFMTSTCALTHLRCAPKQDDVITWLDPASIEINTALLGATAASGATCTYTLAGKVIKIGHKLARGNAQDIEVKSSGNKRYKETTKTFKIDVCGKVQDVVWNGPFAMDINKELEDKHLCATCQDGATLTYTTEDGTAVEVGDVIGTRLTAGTHEISVVAAATTQYEASAPKKVSFTVNKVAQEITWDLGELVAGMDVAVLFNADYAGKDDDEHGPENVDYMAFDESGKVLERGRALEEGEVQLNLSVDGSDWYEDGDAEETVTVAAKPQAGKKKGKDK